ncbi:DNA polymerase III subunit epsilon [Sphingobium sufflavum]|uniref:3'-5' exonuclease n=1 Tax=Sphingobium sufflavum TaxID=1129547 RepID=UPI001EEDB825|nr:3'-5' exonuclease [Sphingobium sufflavum]MCE7797358.1 DNA polymerase III subunit epsilon [Sphingobium sufflavum]
MNRLNASDGDDITASSTHDDWDIRVVRRVGRLEDISLTRNPQAPLRKVGVVDVETTGVDPLHDQIIDIAYVVLEVDVYGEIVSIVRSGQGLSDPGMPIPAEITRLTGITDADVAGKSLDLDLLQRALGEADVLVAHNCRFDAAFLRQLLPATANAAWVCSCRDIDWRAKAGLDGRALGHLLMNIGFFNDGHRAMADVLSLVHLLAYRLPDDRTAIGALLDAAERTTISVEATGAPFSMRHLLKGRGYRWDPSARVWWIEVSAENCEAETLWLNREVMPHGPAPRTAAVTWRERHR